MDQMREKNEDVNDSVLRKELMERNTLECWDGTNVFDGGLQDYGTARDRQLRQEVIISDAPGDQSVDQCVTDDDDEPSTSRIPSPLTSARRYPKRDKEPQYKAQKEKEEMLNKLRGKRENSFLIEQTVDGRGLGCFAKKPISKGTIIAPYVGDRYSIKDANDIADRQKHNSDYQIVYGNKVIDAYEHDGHIARFMNHKHTDDKPNAIMKHHTIVKENVWLPYIECLCDILPMETDNLKCPGSIPNSQPGERSLKKGNH